MKLAILLWLLIPFTSAIAYLIYPLSQETVKDIDGNVYRVKRYNNQAWMTENLKVTRSREGNAITTFAPNDNPENITRYGLLYDFETACMVCPQGWHLPSYDDWRKLLDSFGQDAGLELKDSLAWRNESIKFTNASGFSARPAGYWNSGEFDNLFGTEAIFWSSTKTDTQFAWGVAVAQDWDTVHMAPQHPQYGFSVRCVKDQRR